MSQQLDAQGEARDALGTAVSSYGQRVLSDPHILGNLVTDLLPDLPRERSLLVTGAEAGIAAEMTQHVEEQHIDPDTAVQLVARALSERRGIDPAASMWVASEYAQALGYQVRPYSEALQLRSAAGDPGRAAHDDRVERAADADDAADAGAGRAGTAVAAGTKSAGPSGAQMPQGPSGQVLAAGTAARAVLAARHSRPDSPGRRHSRPRTPADLMERQETRPHRRRDRGRAGGHFPHRRRGRGHRAVQQVQTPVAVPTHTPTPVKPTPTPRPETDGSHAGGRRRPAHSAAAIGREPC